MSRALIGLALLVCSGCASVFHGHRDTILVDSMPQGAQVVVDGIPVGRTPVEAHVDSREGHTLLFRLVGHEDQLVTVRSETLVGFVIADIILTLGIGVAIDAGNGSLYGVAPRNVTATLAPTAPRPIARRDTEDRLASE